MPIASANFFKELFLGFASAFSNRAKAGCLMPAFWESSPWVKLKYSRQAFIRLSPLTFALYHLSCR